MSSLDFGESVSKDYDEDMSADITIVNSLSENDTGRWNAASQGKESWKSVESSSIIIDTDFNLNFADDDHVNDHDEADRIEEKSHWKIS